MNFAGKGMMPPFSSDASSSTLVEGNESSGWQMAGESPVERNTTAGSHQGAMVELRKRDESSGA
jgi:hypothetical protein